MSRKRDHHEPAAPTGPAPFSRMFSVEDLQRDRSVTLTLTANADECRAVAHTLGIEAVYSLTAKLDITRQARSLLKVVGEVRASIEQACVVTLEPFATDVIEPISIRFAPEDVSSREPRKVDVAEAVQVTMEDDPPDPLISGRVDLGGVCVEFLALALDPYPRKPGVAFETETVVIEDEKEPSPFAALASLKPGGPKA